MRACKFAITSKIIHRFLQTREVLNEFFEKKKENVALMTSWRPFCIFMNAALSRSQFCSDFLQILGCVSKTLSRVGYLKSAKSVNNFQSKKADLVYKKSCFWFSRRCQRSVVRSPAGTKVFATWFLYCCDYIWLLLYEKIKWLNMYI